MRVVVIDDHVLFRRFVVDFLLSQDDIIVIGEASSPKAALIMCQEFRPDVALVDIDLGGQDGLNLADEILQNCPDCAVIMLTASQGEAQMRRAVKIGASGYLVKDVEPDSLVSALHCVMEGETVFPRSFLMNQVRHNVQDSGKGGANNDTPLTARELEVLQLVADALTDKEVAEQLSLSENTIKNHMKSVRRKLNAANRVEATMKGVQMGLIENRRRDVN